MVPEDRLGELVADKYQLLRVLGAGGMGAVYEALHRFTDRRVALKILHPQVAGNQGSRFLREAKAAARVRHPAIADVLDAGIDARGTMYLAFELLEGEDLAAAVRRGYLTPELVVTIARELANALSVAHAAGWIHRDLKPPNIFLSRTPSGDLEPKLLDFGIAHQAREQGGQPITQAGTVIGTLFFMSPEQMQGQAIDGRSDLWSLGVVIFYALTGRIPFDALNYLALMAELIKTGPHSLRDYRPELPDRLIAAVDRALRVDPRDRFQTAAEMEAALASVHPSRSITRSRATPPRKTWRTELEEIERENRALAAKKSKTPR